MKCFLKQKITTAIAIVILSVMTVMPPIGCAAASYTVFPPVAAFSDDIAFTAKIAGGRAAEAYERMTKFIAEVDGEVSATRTDSDLYKFNAAGKDERVEVGEHLYNLCVLAKEYYDLTDGAYNAAIAPLVELWRLDPDSIAKYRPDLDGDRNYPTVPDISTVNDTALYCDPDLVTAETRNDRYYLVKSDGRVRLDFGGIAKGYTVDGLKKILDEYDIPSALLDISGNAYFYGRYVDRGENSDWRVGITSPRPRAGESLDRGYIAAVSLYGDVSAVTSGDYMRYYIARSNEKEFYVPHILGTDGLPIGVECDGDGYKNSDEWVISATVIGASSALCDALSTAVAVLGLEKGADLLKKVSCKGLIFTEKRYTIVGDVALYKPDVYDGYKAHTYYEP